MQTQIKYIYILFTMGIFCCNISHGQAAFPDGVYYDIEQLRNRAPGQNIKLAIKQSGKKYKLFTQKNYSDKLLTEEKILAYVANDSLYIRAKGRELNGGSYFSLAMSKGNFIVYFYPTSDAMGYAVSSAMLGIAGPVLMATTRTSQPFFILSLRTGNIKPFNEEYVENRLKEIRPDLMETFQKEPNKTIGLLLNYIDEMNISLSRE